MAETNALLFNCVYEYVWFYRLRLGIKRNSISQNLPSLFFWLRPIFLFFYYVNDIIDPPFYGLLALHLSLF